jgi:hypothetical protein
MATVGNNPNVTTHQTTTTTDNSQVDNQKKTTTNEGPPPPGHLGHENEEEGILDAPRQVRSDLLVRLQSFVGQDLALMLAQLMHEMGNEQRQAAREARHAARDLQQSELMNAAQKTRDAGMMNLIGGMVSAGVQAASAGIQLAGSIKGGVQAQKQATQMTQKYEGVTNDGFIGPKTQAQAKADFHARMDIQSTATKTGDMITQRWTATSQLVGAGAPLAQGLFAYLGSLEEAEKSELEARATKAQTHADDESERMQLFQDLIQKAQQFLQEANRSNNEAFKNTLQI